MEVWHGNRINLVLHFLNGCFGGNPFALTKENMILWPLVIGFVIYSAVSSYRETERCTYETLMFCTNTANKVEVEWHNEGDWRTQYTVIDNIELLGKRPRDGLRFTDKSGNKFDVEFKNIGEITINGRSTTQCPVVE